MTPDTKYLRLSKPAELGDEIDGWRVCWIGGWSKHLIVFVVMVLRPSERSGESARGDQLKCAGRERLLRPIADQWATNCQ